MGYARYQQDPPDPETRTPAKAATMAGENEGSATKQALRYISRQSDAISELAAGHSKFSTDIALDRQMPWLSWASLTRIIAAKGRAPRDIATDIRRNARQVLAIHDPLRSNPEQVFELKDEIAKYLEALAREIEAGHG